MEQKFLQFFNARFVAYQLIYPCLLGFFVYEMLDYITATTVCFFKFMKFDCCPPQKRKWKGGGGGGEIIKTCRTCRLFPVRAIIFLSGDPKL